MRQFIIPYLIFKNSYEVAKYYERVFDGKIEYIMYGKDTPNCKEEDLDKIIHLELVVNGNYIYMADGNELPSNQSMLLLDYKNLENMKIAYNNMLPDAKEIMPLKDTFWGAIFGALEDKYGYRWEFHYMKPKK
ncbi:hypothetical protein ACAG96_07715 [Candidatus Izemoplasma sp. B36]|uniref:hypothetical protein n=1 Tax=Candidatus Izemoplasma sp. B36 TaxID=3242468 RepID=UPI00355613F1